MTQIFASLFTLGGPVCFLLSLSIFKLYLIKQTAFFVYFRHWDIPDVCSKYNTEKYKKTWICLTYDTQIIILQWPSLASYDVLWLSKSILKSSVRNIVPKMKMIFFENQLKFFSMKIVNFYLFRLLRVIKLKKIIRRE